MTLNYDLIRHSVFIDRITELQFEGLETILSEWNKQPENEDKRWLAYILATVLHESGAKFQPVTEYGGKSYLKSKKYYPYYGRDLCQTTWKWNYQKVKDFSDIDVVSHPELIGQMPLAATVCITFMIKGWYTGRKLSDYFNSVFNDPIKARRIINGSDKAELIAGHYYKFLEAIT